MTNDEIRYWLALTSVRRVGSIVIKRLLEHFKTPAKIFRASRREIMEIKGIGEQTALEIAAFEGWKKIDAEIRKARALGIDIVTWDDESYPENLRHIPDPPPVLYVRGRIENSDSLALAVVGSRNATASGLEITENFCYRLARAGITIISGGARGIDSSAHSGALRAGGRTLAVMGCGLDTTYPRENGELFHRVASNGALVSEFSLGTRPEAGNFPRRNRIVSGLSLGVLVVEASLKSGSLITAKYALDQGREVYAVPGGIRSANTRGTNALIKEGAVLVERAEDILEDLLPLMERRKPQEKEHHDKAAISLDEKEEKLFSLLGAEPMHLDQIVEKSMMNASEVTSLLLQLELSGVVRQHPGKLFTKAFI